jgi:hypothetical protein
MYNLYSITTNQEAISRLFRKVNRYVGNVAPMPGVFPDYPAPVIRNAGDEREMVLMRWGMPPPPKFGGPPVTNIRNTSSPHWRAWMKPENRCLVPFNSFAEYAPEANPETKKKDVVWFALKDDRPLTAFAGIWTEFKGDRGTKVPAGPDWIHEIKHDGYRLIVQREGKRVRLFTRNGHDWTDRYPLIVEEPLELVRDRWRGGAARRRRRVRLRRAAFRTA